MKRNLKTALALALLIGGAFFVSACGSGLRAFAAGQVSTLEETIEAGK